MFIIKNATITQISVVAALPFRLDTLNHNSFEIFLAICTKMFNFAHIYSPYSPYSIYSYYSPYSTKRKK